MASSRFIVPLVLVILRVGGAAAGLFFTLLMARTMSQAEMGHAVTATSLTLLLPLLACGSINVGAPRFITQYLVQGRKDAARGYIRRSWQIGLTLGTLLILVGALVLWVRARQSGSPWDGVYMIAVITSSIMGMVRIESSNAMGFGHVMSSVVPTTFGRPVLALIALAAWWAMGFQVTAYAVIMSYAVTAVIILVLQVVLLLPDYRELGKGPADYSPTGKWIRYGLMTGAVLLMFEFSKDLTVTVAAFSLPPEDIAKLGVYLSLVGFAKFGVVAVTQSTIPKMSRDMGVGDMASLYNVARESNLMKLAAMVVAYLGFWFFGDDILGLYGPDFRADWPILLILMFEPFSMAIFGPGATVLSLSDNQRSLMIGSLMSVAALVVSVTIGAQMGGIYGVAIAVALTWSGFSLGLALQARKELGVDLTLISTLLRRRME